MQHPLAHAESFSTIPGIIQQPYFGMVFCKFLHDAAVRSVEPSLTTSTSARQSRSRTQLKTSSKALPMRALSL
jgi:hypothetical protein